jgi:excinuclease UvrABC helicase subunit UvrB
MLRLFLFNDFEDLFNDFGKKSFDESKLNKEVEEGSDGTHTWKKETWSSVDGSFYKTKTVFTTKQFPKKSISELKDALQKALKEERYEDAAKLRDEIKSIENI